MGINKNNYLKNYRENLISKGMCSGHPNNPVVSKRKKCQECLNYYKNRTKLWDNFLISKGLNICSKCGYQNYIGVINFHHRDSKEKKYNIAKLKNKNFSEKNIIIFLNEIFKCDILCSNCHREIHSKINKNKFKTLYAIEWNKILKQRGQDKCSKCGYNKCLDAIEFHHIDSDEKEINISILKQKKFKPEYLKELDKCIALCSNCHRELHNGNNKFFKN